VNGIKLPAVDVRRVREKLNLSQSEFASKFGFSPACVRNWEQGRNRPAGAARILLTVIERNPQAVEEAIRP
jgi:putative transcriptional regulator